jgi:hypothetical protein
VVAHVDRQAFVRDPRRDVDGRAWRRILRGVLQQARQRGGGQAWIELDRHVRIDGDRQGVLLQGVLDLVARGRHDL